MSLRQGTLNVHARPGTRVHVRQERHGFEFGTPLGGDWITQPENSPERQVEEALVEELFNAGVIPVKWAYLEPEPGKRNYEKADRILDWCNARHFAVRGHCLFYAHRIHVQPWVRAIADDAEVLAAMERHARGVVRRYRGRIKEYDLNNELLDGQWYRDRFGPEILKRMAEWVLDEDPDIKLYVNEHDIITGGDIDRYVELIEQLLQAGFPLAGIGCQGHIDPPFDLSQLKSVLDRLAQFNLPIKLTEHDCGIKLKEERYRGVSWIDGAEKDKDLQKFAAILASYPEDFELQKAAALEAFYRTAFAHPAVAGIYMWGYRENHHWRTRGEIFREDFTPLPAGQAYRKLVRQDWWTDTETQTDAEGVCQIHPFFGIHRVSLGEQSCQIELTPESPELCLEEWR